MLVPSWEALPLGVGETRLRLLPRLLCVRAPTWCSVSVAKARELAHPPPLLGASRLSPHEPALRRAAGALKYL